MKFECQAEASFLAASSATSGLVRNAAEGKQEARRLGEPIRLLIS
jgi:hypothetical protein